MIIETAARPPRLAPTPGSLAARFAELESRDLVSRKIVMERVCTAVADWMDSGKRSPLSLLLIDTINAIPSASGGAA